MKGIKMDVYEDRANMNEIDQELRFEQSTDQNHFWTTFELDLHELIVRDRRLSETYHKITV